MSTSTDGQQTDTKKNAKKDTDDTTYIVDRYTDEKGNQVENRMPMSEWPAYAKENGL